MTIDTAAEALRSIPGLKMKSLEQRREIVRVVLDNAWETPPRSIADLGAEDGDGPLPVYKGEVR